MAKIMRIGSTPVDWYISKFGHRVTFDDKVVPVLKFKRTKKVRKKSEGKKPAYNKTMVYSPTFGTITLHRYLKPYVIARHYPSAISVSYCVGDKVCKVLNLV